MNIRDWADLHGETNSDAPEHDIITQTVEIEVSNYVVYEVKAEVILFRGLPAEVKEIVQMTRQLFDYDGDGSLLDEMELECFEYPHYIVKAAEKKIMEML